MNDDLISRNDLIQELQSAKYLCYDNNSSISRIQNHEIDRCISFVETAPTIEERPTGKWVVDIIGHKGDKTTIMRFKCSNCGTVISWIPGEKYPTKESFLNAHPGCFCGARMEVPADEQKTGN